MRIPVALLKYTIVAPSDVASPVVTESVIKGNPIEVEKKILFGSGWTMLKMRLKPIPSYGDVNLSLLVLKRPPVQAGQISGCQGSYLQQLRARTHTWLQGSGGAELAAKRRAEYEELGALSMPAGQSWGEPRKSGRAKDIATPPVTAGTGARKGKKDITPRARRRDLYIVYTAPHGEEVAIRAMTPYGRELLANGALLPYGWKHRLESRVGPLDRRPMHTRVTATRADTQGEQFARMALGEYLQKRRSGNGPVPELRTQRPLS